MTIDYTIIEEDRLVIANGSGIITSDDVRKHLDALAADERYVPHMKKLVDYRSINGIQQTKKFIILS